MATVTKELNTLAEEVVEVGFTWGVTASKLQEFIEKSPYKPLYGETEMIDDLVTQLVLLIPTK